MCSSMAGGRVTRSRRSVSCTTSASDTAVRCGGSLRLKVRICRTRSRARRPALSISSRLSSTGEPGAQSALASSTLPRMAPRMLLKSCAMPPAMVPTACILCDSRSCASSSLRCASAFLRPVRSRANTVVVSPSAWRSNDTPTSTASSLALAVQAVISPSMAWVVSCANASACPAAGKKRSSGLPSASCALHWNSAAAVGLNTVMRPFWSTQMMASSAELMTASSRFSLACSCSLRCCSACALCCSAWRSASRGPWSITAHKNCSCTGPSPWWSSMRAMCKSPVMRVCGAMVNTTSVTSLCPWARACAKASCTRGASVSDTNGISAVRGRSRSVG